MNESNELMIVLEGRNWIYFLTDETTVSGAWNEFHNKCEKLDINIDNCRMVRMDLRDPSGNTIESKQS